MVEIITVKTAKERKEFLNYPLRLYKNNPYFVPPLYGDEAKIFSKNFAYRDTCETEYYLAVRDGKVVGRVSAILQKASNAKTGEKRVRFTRFDCENDEEVASALLDAVEKFAVAHGMDTVCGPLGFSDLEREGLLVDGFGQLSTYEEQYNYEYYPRLIEKCGYEKEVDWIESQLRAPKNSDDLKKTADFVMKRYGLKVGKAKSTRDLLDKYATDVFKLLDVAYDGLYGTVPFTEEMKNTMLDNFKLVIDLKHVIVILNEADELVCFGVCFPSLAKAVQKSNGKITPLALFRLLKAIKKPSVIDLGLVAVRPDYLNRGITAVIASGLADMLKEDGIEYAETNLNLEDNYAIRNLWKRFDTVEHKRRRCYVKRAGVIK